MGKLMAAILTIIVLAGCGNGTYDKAMEQGKLALANKEFDKALASFELALNEKPKDKAAKQSYDNLIALLEVKEDIRNEKWEAALERANKLLEQNGLVSSLKKELNQSIKTAEAGKAQIKLVTEKVENIKVLVDGKNFSEAQRLITELKQDQKVKEVFNRFSEEVNKIEVTVNEELKKQKEAEEAAAKEKAQAAAGAAAASKKKEFIIKLNDIEEGFAELNYLYANGVTSEMLEAENEKITRWDNALNEIYGYLKLQLPASEMNKLKEEQRQWIKDRDRAANASAANSGGGSMAELEYVGTVLRLTKERCYELLSIYIK
ncbi:lysozyme inhibitor LprI family protein [Neobacillus sp. NPDC058068]|uniref:lysozyme inhibitor LprI family protein n=1 Tax=Neobacillus sp. NPDC058068 TaxID=3346325 RepID=UPI0036D9CAC1